MAASRLAPLALLVLCSVSASALDNGLGRLPGMGWNSDYCTDCASADGFQNDKFIRHIGNYLNTSNMAKLGYKYVNMDASWNLPTRDKNGNMQPDPKLWPNGIESVIAYIHELGLGFGLYGDRGTYDCAKNPGNLGHEVADAKYYASLNIDWYKSDSCYASADHQTAFDNYGKMRDALNATGRPIWFALCGWNTWYGPVGKNLGNSWRVGPDTVCGWHCVMENVVASLSISNCSGPTAHGGGWNDMCLLLNPGFSGMTKDQHRSQFNMWCILAANLLMTGNLSAIDPFAIETWSNPEAIAVNQDPAGYAAIPLVAPSYTFEQDPVTGRLPTINYVRAHVQECGGEPELQQWTFDQPMKGFVRNAKANVCLNVEGCKTDVIYDGCTTTGGTCAGKSSYSNEQFTLVNNTLQSSLSGDKCIAVDTNGDLLRQACNGGQTQRWSYDNTTQQLLNNDGRCLTAGASSKEVSLIVGRPLADKSWAMAMLNNQAVNASMSCDAGCFAKMGFAASDTVVVRDLWLHKTVATVKASDGWASPPLAAEGGSTLVTLKKQ